jgi:TonB family protein
MILPTFKPVPTESMLLMRVVPGLLLVLATATTVMAQTQSRAEGTYRLGPVEVDPALRNARQVGRLLEREYPVSLRSSGVSGTVVVRFAVEPHGRVDATSITIVTTANEQFNEPARRVVQRLRFHPAQNHGKPVRVVIEMPLRFGPTPPSVLPQQTSGTAPKGE